MKNIILLTGALTIMATVSSFGQNKTTLPKAPPPPPIQQVAPPPPPPTLASQPSSYDSELSGKNLKEIYLEENQIYSSVDVQPEFPGGNDALYKYVGANLKYPAAAKENNITGKVIVQFIIEKDGTISTPTIIRDEVGYGATDEVLRILKGMPSWKAGQQDGKIVRVQYTLPVKFKL
ncbi:MAG: energy transducer TonB [Saprospiraceae bacterium]|jgi:protein TonB|uniref:energy transducer TonB n=1 Tax=Candidatus Brachybacter algidus TaxID=2982024 RepID=UPI001B6834F2|nr:energy transducer TonB [Candidatus Brachybacter algidus]MBP7540743.1 energy transducer TonB [Saprospiraceae bacterium]MBK6373197.1 energy transducer TonB [Candidatus Brachybacter algidus]MBK6447847.1 energy transducer TonB [Candidatus Brachybacter algidus]MBK7602658.1 energy transducer TonB [Candidatus Brachybacter algidus]MBK8354686.1 energy transducer TonB [Candidatus Brachybacter algidus]